MLMMICGSLHCLSLSTTAWTIRSSKTASEGFACDSSNCSAVEDGASCSFAEASVDTEARKSKTGQKDSSGVVQIICIAYSQSMLQRLFELSLSLFRSWHLMFGVRLTARDQSVIDAGANVVHAFPEVILMARGNRSWMKLLLTTISSVSLVS